ncbi:HNH endonuclease [Paenibacillus sp. DMB20]|nr:HNH endonuclease [Paenibacillus sp. DMB20]
MRGKTDKGRRWQQDIDLELAVILVMEGAAVVVNRHTIRRLYTNKGFRQYVLERDGYTCYFCGRYGDTIDHLLPRAKGGHTTPVNCVCACMECNQSKADRDLEDFIHSSRS